MIKPEVIHKISNKEGVRPQQIEKDYIISWVLWGISGNGVLEKALIFKGGTCLKKIHIEGYRYSEDMDFTLNPDLENDISDNEMYAAFEEVFTEIKEAANIDLSIPEASKETHPRTQNIRFYIDYLGPLGGKQDHVKLDVTKGEQLEFEVERGLVQHTYTDLEEEGDFFARCYGLKEILIEKMAALMGRTVPRDLYDFDYLTSTEGIEVQDVFYEFERKAAHKGYNPADFANKLTGKQKTYENAWNKNLSHQIRDLPNFKEVWRHVSRQLRKFEKIK